MSFLTRTIFWFRPRPQSLQLPYPGTIRFRNVSNLGCYSHFDFGAGTGPAPHIQVRANFLCALSHSRQSKMSFPISVAKNGRVNSRAVVPDSYAQLASLVVELHFN